MASWWRLYKEEATYALLIGAVIVAVWATRQVSVGVPGFCRQTFRELASGKPSAQSRLEWERLSAMGLDVGMAYRSFARGQDRQRYMQKFIQSFANSFRQQGAKPDDFVRWRLVGETPVYLVVGADYPAKQRTLLFAVPKDGKRRVAAIQWAS